MSSSTVYLVTGANRGIGLGIVKQLLLKPNTVVFAGVRNPDTATNLLALQPQEKLHVVRVVSTDKPNNEEAIKQIKSIAGKLDVVIANAGICQSFAPALETDASQMIEHFNINAVGPLILFQASYPVLKASPQPKFVIVSSIAGSIEIGTTFPFGLTAYGASKAAVDYVTRKIHFEHPSLVALAINPGGVDTDMGAFSVAAEPTIAAMGPLLTIEESGNYIVTFVENATREKDSGLLWNYDGAKLAW